MDGGASQESYLTDRVSHVIADDDEHPEISEARDLFDLPVVSVSHSYRISLKGHIALDWASWSR